MNAAIQSTIYGSVLIFGGNKTARDIKIIEVAEKSGGFCFDEPTKRTLNELSKMPDVTLIKPFDGKKTIGIDQVRLGVRFLSEKPFSCNKKFIIIPEAEKLTIQAQNALLKTLEEPPSYGVIILGAKTENNLLETVVSRCRRIGVDFDVNGVGEDETLLSIENVLGLNVGERLDWVSEFYKEDRAVVIDTLELWVREERNTMKSSGEIEVMGVKARNIEAILGILDDLENTNVSVRLSLEVLILGLI